MKRLLVVLFGFSLLGLIAGASVAAADPCGGGTFSLVGTTASCSYTSPGTFVLGPLPGVTQVTVAAAGGHGSQGAFSGAPGGRGEALEADFATPSGSSFSITVGANPGAGGGGGGAFVGSGNSGVTLGDVLLAAGGGGGGGGAGSSSTPGGAGGDSALVGSPGATGIAGSSLLGTGGLAGSGGLITGGPGAPTFGNDGVSGDGLPFANGGDGGSSPAFDLGTGGGGGGGYGGGNGGLEGTTVIVPPPFSLGGGGGGGGGSSFLDPSATHVLEDFSPSGPAWAEVSWTTAVPTVTVAPTASPNAEGWFTSAPVAGTVSATELGSTITALTCTDNGGIPFVPGSLGGLGTATASGTFSVSGDGPHVVNCIGTDVGGLTGSGNSTVKLETLVPSINLVSPTSTTYQQGQVVTPSYSCAGGDSFDSVLPAACLDSNGGTESAPGAVDTSTTGIHHYTVAAFSVDGLENVKSLTYLVQAPGAPAPPFFATTSTGLASTLGSAGVGQPVTFVALVNPGGVYPAPYVPFAGTVLFTNGGATIPGCSAVPVNVTGYATCTTSFNAPGSYAIQAIYSGVFYASSSSSPVITQLVTMAPPSTAPTTPTSPTSPSKPSTPSTQSGPAGHVFGIAVHGRKVTFGVVCADPSGGCLAGGVLMSAGRRLGYAYDMLPQGGFRTFTITAPSAGHSSHHRARSRTVQFIGAVLSQGRLTASRAETLTLHG